MHKEFQLTLRNNVEGNPTFRVVMFNNLDEAFAEARKSDLDYLIESSGFKPIAYRIGGTTHSN